MPPKTTDRIPRPPRPPRPAKQKRKSLAPSKKQSKKQTKQLEPVDINLQRGVEQLRAFIRKKNAGDPLDDFNAQHQ